MNRLVSCNPKYYNVVNAFAASSTLYWKQILKDVSVDDEVFIYVARPVSAIKYRCKVLEAGVTNYPASDAAYVIDGSYYETYPLKMQIELLEEYPDDKYTLKKLHSYGLKGTIQGQQRLKIELPR